MVAAEPEAAPTWGCCAESLDSLDGNVSEEEECLFTSEFPASTVARSLSEGEPLLITSPTSQQMVCGRDQRQVCGPRTGEVAFQSGMSSRIQELSCSMGAWSQGAESRRRTTNSSSLRQRLPLRLNHLQEQREKEQNAPGQICCLVE